ncbi:integrase [Phormidium tenue FACHB-886]|nr:integrase [Phormidium tenue FACHB-886]
MNMIRKGQVKGIDQGDIVSQARFIEALFGISA